MPSLVSAKTGADSIRTMNAVAAKRMGEPALWSRLGVLHRPTYGNVDRVLAHVDDTVGQFKRAIVVLGPLPA